MKKIIALVLCVVIAFTLCSCAGGTEDTSTEASGAVSSTVSSAAESSKAASSRVVSIVQKDKPVRILPMGDSLTQGKEHDNCGAYRPALLEMLDNDGVEYVFTGKHDWSRDNVKNFQFMHSGYGGATVELLASELQHVKNRDPDIVLLMIGRNDSGKGYYGSDLSDKIRDQLVIPMLEMYPDATIYVAGIPPKRNGSDKTMNTGERPQTESNPAIKAMVEELKSEGKPVKFVDMSVEATGLTYEDYNEQDSTHPLPVGYEKIAKQWHNAIKDDVKAISDKINGR